MFPNETTKIRILLTGLVLVTAAFATEIVVKDALAILRFTMDLEQQNNDFTEEPQYDVTPREFVTFGADPLCPTDNCSFELNDSEFRKNTFSPGYVLTGELVAERPSQTEGETFSTFNEIRVDLDRISATESNGVRTENLLGDMDAAGNKYLIAGNVNFTDNEATELLIAGGSISE